MQAVIQSAEKQGPYFRVVLAAEGASYLALFGAKFVDGLVAAAQVKTFDEVVGRMVLCRIGCQLAPGGRFAGYVSADSFEKAPT